MDKPRCQGCLGELKVERPDGVDPYVCACAAVHATTAIRKR